MGALGARHLAIGLTILRSRFPSNPVVCLICQVLHTPNGGKGKYIENLVKVGLG